MVKQKQTNKFRGFKKQFRGF